MASQNAQPSIDPADIGTFIGMFRTILKKHLQATDDMLPATVVAFDRTANMVQVQPMIMLRTTDGTNVVRAQIASIPVVQLGGGGFMLNFNIKPGDTGFIKANDRDISLYLQSLSQGPPNTYRLHSFSDGVFIPSVLKGFTIADEDEENAVFQSLDGSVRVSLFADKVKVTAPTVEIDATTTTITGNLVVGGGIGWGSVEGGDIVGTGNLVTTGEVTAKGIPLSTHHHGGVQTGTGNTGGPAA